jgi:geranylgeranyl reductase family protein
MSRQDADVIVVGGGPAGAATAYWLNRRGLDVLLLDRARFPREKACGEYLSPGVWDILARMDALSRIEPIEHRLHPGMLIRTPHEQFMVGYDQCTDPRLALSIQRPAFDHAVLKHAESSGVNVSERCSVAGALVEDGRVVGVRLRAVDSREELRARFVVAADGLHSTVARSLGLERKLRWPRRLGLIARYRMPPGTSLQAVMHVGSGLYCGLNPVGDDLLNVGLVGSLGGKLPGESTAELFERRLADLPEASRALAGGSRITPIRGMGPMARRVRRVSGPGYLLVGDAAGFLDPFTGEGIFRALRGAELAADAIVAAVERNLAAPFAYAEARRR